MKETALAYLAEGLTFFQTAEKMNTTPQEIIKIYVEHRASK